MKIKETIEKRLFDVFGSYNFHIIAITMSGSHAYGMQTKNSDIDIMGIFLPPKSYIIGLDKVEQIIINKEECGFEGTMFSFEKWYKLMIQQNPNTLELLWEAENSYIYTDNNYFNLLLRDRKKFLSKKIKHSLAGYAFAQIQRLSKLNEKVNENKKRLEEFQKFGFSTKNASHVFRLLNMCLDALVEGEINVLRPERQFLIAIREGKYTYDEIVKMSNEKFALIEQAYITSSVPNKVDMKFANKIYMDIVEDYLRLK